MKTFLLVTGAIVVGQVVTAVLSYMVVMNKTVFTYLFKKGYKLGEKLEDEILFGDDEEK